MPLDARTRRFLDVLTASGAQSLANKSVHERRTALAELMKLGGPPAAVALVEDRRIGASFLGVRVYTPMIASQPTDSLLPGLIFFHGGGLVAGDLVTHDTLARALADAGACRVLSVDYRLAPEHPFPAALEDALVAMRYIAAHAAAFGVLAARLGICGDSAGGTLAAAACQAMAANGEHPFALQLLLCPILDYSRSTPSRHELQRGYLLDQDTLDHDLRHYLPTGVDPADPRISPLRADDLRGLPRTVIHAAEFDPLRDEARNYGERLERSGNEVSFTCHPGMIHLFYGLGGVIPYARTALRQIGEDIRLALSVR